MSAHIVVINLDRDQARWAHISAQLDALGLRYERFAAIDGAAVPLELRGYLDGDALTRGEAGCYASHLAICARVVSGALPSPVLVLEDDVGLPPDLPFLLRALLRALPEGWDIVRLSYPTKRVTQPLAQLGGGRELVRYSHVPVSTGAYLLSAAGAAKFLAPVLRDLPIDQDLRRVWAWALDTYGVTPPPVRNDVCEGSTIDAMGARWSKRRSAARRWRRAKETFARHARGVEDFGAPAWLTVEAMNVVARLTPRTRRPAFLRWAQARLAQAAQPPTPAVADDAALSRVTVGAPTTGSRMLENASHSAVQDSRVNVSAP